MWHTVGILMLLLLVVGCAGPTTPTPTATRDALTSGGAVPPDFALSITVVDREQPGRPTLSRSLRPARYIVEPDMVLRVSVGPGSATTTYPPAMRTLTHAQVRKLWESVESAGYLRTDPRSQVANTETRPPAVAGPTALLFVSGDGLRRSLQVSLDGPDAGPTRSLIDRLAELGWVAP